MPAYARKLWVVIANASHAAGAAPHAQRHEGPLCGALGRLAMQRGAT
jgi:hypothetical protein